MKSLSPIKKVISIWFIMGWYFRHPNFPCIPAMYQNRHVKHTHFYFVSDGLCTCRRVFPLLSWVNVSDGLKTEIRSALHSIRFHTTYPKQTGLKFQVLKSGICLHYPNLFRTFALSNKGELPFDWFGWDQKVWSPTHAKKKVLNNLTQLLTES